jgi:hypothetical protein
MSNDYFNHTNRFVKLDTVRAGDVNNVFDNVESGFDDVETKTNAAIKLPDGETSVALPGSGTRANKVLTFDGSGNIEATIAKVDVATVAGIAGDIEIVANNIADINSAVDNMAAILDAPAQASAAAVSANAAAASLDEFDDRYLGAKAADPTLDNDGNALISGALYFKTGVGAGMRVWTGSDWEAAYIPVSGYLSLSDVGTTVQAYDADIPTVAASQVEMEAGTEVALRSMSPLRVKQAIDALGSGGSTPHLSLMSIGVI